MEIIRATSDWAKAEIVSSLFFIFFGLIYIIGSICSWKLGNSPLSKALFIPLMIAGGLLFVAGISFYLSSKSKLDSFEKEFMEDSSSTIKAEITKAKSTIRTYKNVALKVFPAIMILGFLIFLFSDTPIVKAICISVIAFLLVLVVLDSLALKRMETYHQKLELANERIRKN